MPTTETHAARRAPQPAPARREGLRTVASVSEKLLRAAQIVFAKGTVSRRQPPVVRNLAEYESPDFVYDTTSLEAVQRRMEAVRPDARGMRYVHSPEVVLFYVERDLAIPYDEFVSRVDISKVGLMFRDVLGITTRVVKRDEHGRSLLQLERIAALAQPNYSAFMGKDELDVYKLEKMDYSHDEQRNWMRTVHSPNRSALCDDGYLAFVRTATGTTRITFLACQHFPMPRLMVLTGVARWAWLKNRLTESAYRRFFDETMDNIVAGYEGRDFRIGRGPRPGTSTATVPAQRRPAPSLEGALPRD